MSQGVFTTIVPSTTSGNQLATILNDFKDAVISGFSGTSRPSEIDPGGYWIDTTNNPTSWDFKIYTGVTDITVFTLNLSTGIATISSADTLFQISKISADSVGPIMRLLKKRISGGGQTLIGDILGEVQFSGSDASGVTTLQARIKSVSSNNVTAGQNGAYLAFEMTTFNGSSVAEVLRMVDGKVGVGVTAPDKSLHVVGTGVKSEYLADDAVGAKVFIKKGRVAGSGQVLNNDVTGVIEFQAKDNTGVEVPSVQIESSVRQNQTNSAQASQLKIRTKKTGQTTFTDQITIGESVTVNTDLTVTGNLVINGTTTTVNSTTMDVVDPNISVNKGGNQSTANTNKAGVKVEMSDATHAQIGYDSTKASKFVIGNVGSEVEVADVSSTQTFSGKTLSSPVINSPSISTPSKLEVKQGTEAALTTYALTAGNGQWCFATDTKVMYQVIDTALVPAGAGGGGTTLSWIDGTNAPVLDFTEGFKAAAFDNVSNQELFSCLTVPQSYRAGKQIQLKAGQFFTTSITGNVRFRTVAYLIRSGTVIGTYTNTRTSSNAQVAVSGVANTITSIGNIDLTDSTGQINSVAVAAGDKIRIKLFRDNATETSGAANDAKLIVDSFEPTFS